MFTRQSDESFALKKLTLDIPMDLSTTQFSLDSVKFVRTQETNKTHLFVRSQTHKSRLYYGYQDWSSGEWSEFKPIGDSDLYLYFDFDVVVNTFVSVSFLILAFSSFLSCYCFFIFHYTAC